VCVEDRDEHAEVSRLEVAGRQQVDVAEVGAQGAEALLLDRAPSVDEHQAEALQSPLVP
jgi:hypothetical protein